MPGRLIPLVTDQIYHIINRGAAAQPIFLGKKDYQRALETIFYYQNLQPPLRYSFFQRLPSDKRREILAYLRKRKEFFIDIIAYCLMPNHIHLLVKQLHDDGVSKFMSNFTNSYTRYFNTRKKRVGPLFQGKFKAVRIETDEQLIHVSRYIHLNPYSSYIVKSLAHLKEYPYSSLLEYLFPEKSNLCNKEMVLEHFRNIISYRKFLFDQSDYQRELDKIKHLLLEK